MSVTRLLFDMPPEIAALPRDHRGYPVPKFASFKDGKWDFVLADLEFMGKAVKQKLCWLCGGRLGKRMWFVTGPMCTLTRASAEPPCHRGCAIFAVKNCPFMTKPLAKRADVSGREHIQPGGEMILRNPGVMAVYETKSYRVHLDPLGRPVMIMGDPDDITWWREGREAKPDEIIHSLETGLPELYKMAASEGPIAQYELQQMIDEYVATTLIQFMPQVTSESNKGLTTT